MQSKLAPYERARHDPLLRQGKLKRTNVQEAVHENAACSENIGVHERIIESCKENEAVQKVKKNKKPVQSVNMVVIVL